MVEGVTTCGKSLGGMLFKEITFDEHRVTCTQCLNSDKLPLDILAHTPL